MVEKIVKEFMQENNIPGVAVELYVDGKPKAYYFGYANKAKKIPITKNTIFEVGSITKLFTSLLLAQQVDAAKVQLDNSIMNYLPNLPNKFEDITLGNLATHTSGLSFTVPDTIHSKTALRKYFSNWSPVYCIDEEWAYSNIGMALLGEALEKMAHKKIGQLYSERILSPLKMTASALNEPDDYKKFIAQGYDKEGNPAKPTVFKLFSAGALKMSAADMQRFMAVAIGLPGTPERIFYPMRMTQAAYVKLPDREQGLGWEIHSLKPNKIALLVDEPETMNLGPVKIKEIYDKPKFNGDALIDKTGATDGFRSYIAIIPNKKAGIVILANRYVAHDEIVNTAREILFKATKIEIEHDEEDEEE